MRMFKHQIKLLLIGLLAVCGILPAAAARAQAAPINQQAAELSTPIRLMLGQTTLQKLMQEMSQQTGLIVEAADYLQERRLTVQMPVVTVREALDAITEMYGWRWFSPASRHYQVARKRPPAISNAAEAAQAVVQALPVDIDRFARTGAPLKHEDHADAEKNLPYFAASKRRREIEQKLTDFTNHAPQSLLLLLKPLLFSSGQPTDRKLYLSQMTTQQRSALFLLLLLQAYSAGSALMRGELAPYQSDPLNANIEVSGEMMTISGYAPATGGASVSTRIRPSH